MSNFYYDDEEDYYHGGYGGSGSSLQNLKSSLEAGKMKFTLDDPFDSDEEESPQFAGSFQFKHSSFGGTAKPEPKKPKKQTTKISLRDAFGGAPTAASGSDDEEWSDDDIDIFGGSPDSDSDLSDDDVKIIKQKAKGRSAALNNAQPSTLNRYKKLQTEVSSASESEEEEYGGCDDFPKLGGFELDGDDPSDDDYGGSSVPTGVVKNPFDW